jgi:predicted ATPase
MQFLKSFKLPSEDVEYRNIIVAERRTVFNSIYPCKLFSEKGLEELKFKEINIIYGDNGSGKSTLLNIIAEKINAIRNKTISKGNYFDNYLSFTDFEFNKYPEEIKIITSDDVFEYLLDIRNINAKTNNKRNELFDEWVNSKYSSEKFTSANYDSLKKTVEARKKTMSGYVRANLNKNNIVEQSNGESALMYFENEIGENALYILDEPENSLSAENQLKLAKFIEESARFYNCQFIISSHSPFFLSMKDAHILDLDEKPPTYKKWTELKNIRFYYDFFKEKEEDFK